MKLPKRNLDCKYCGRDFKSEGWELYCPSCLHKMLKTRGISSTTIRMIRNREFLKNYKKNKKCAICGYKKCPEILDFHHENAKSKFGDVSKLARTLKSIAVIKHEIEKCTLICPNCHREVHIGDRYGRKKE